MNNGIRLAGLVLSAALVNACTATPAPEDRSAGTTSSIIGGSADSGHSSTGMMRIYVDANHTQFTTCTGTVVAPRVVVTAGHCSFNGATLTGARLFDADISFDDQPDLGAAPGTNGFIGGKITPNPAWRDTPGTGKDVSVLYLAKDAPVPAVRLGAAPSRNASLTAVGYGRNIESAQQSANDGTGLKRKVTLSATAVNAHEITAGKDGKGTCHGDSGGPLFQGDRLVGLVSYGDTADCRGSSHFTRIDDNADFIQSFLDSPEDDSIVDDDAIDRAADSADGAGDGDVILRGNTVIVGGDDVVVDRNGHYGGCSSSISCTNGRCVCGNGQSCDGRSGGARSCSSLCNSCN